jgi:hypothetical protein
MSAAEVATAVASCPPWCVAHVCGDHQSEIWRFSRRDSGVYIAQADGEPPRLGLSVGETPEHEVSFEDPTPHELAALRDAIGQAVRVFSLRGTETKTS